VQEVIACRRSEKADIQGRVATSALVLAHPGGSVSERAREKSRQGRESRLVAPAVFVVRIREHCSHEKCKSQILLTTSGTGPTTRASKLAAAQLRHSINVKITYQNREPRPVRLHASQEHRKAYQGPQGRRNPAGQ